MTEWRPVPGIPAYEVSSEGRVRHARRRVPLAIYYDDSGYPRACMFHEGKPVTKKVHRLVALAFHGDKRTILHNEVAHLDGDRANPRAENLKWVSKVENHSHKKLHGTHQAGEKHPRAKLTEGQAGEIIAELARRQSSASLARRFGVAPSTIDSIRSGKNWKHLPRSGRPNKV